MNGEETENLLELLSAANVLNKLEELGPDVWEAALGDLDYTDCMQAAANLVRTHQWVKISDVRKAVREMRAARIKAAMPVYEPPQHDESGAEFVARYRGQLEAAGSGQAPPVVERVVLGGPPHPSVALAVANSFQRVPELEPGSEIDEDGNAVDVSDVRRPGPLGVKCPKCSAAIGRPCRTPGGKERAAHPVRSTASKGQPVPDESTTEREIERRREASRRHLAALPADAMVEPQDGYTAGGQR